MMKKRLKVYGTITRPSVSIDYQNYYVKEWIKSEAIGLQLASYKRSTQWIFTDYFVSEKQAFFLVDMMLQERHDYAKWFVDNYALSNNFLQARWKEIYIRGVRLKFIWKDDNGWQDNSSFSDSKNTAELIEYAERVLHEKHYAMVELVLVLYFTDGEFQQEKLIDKQQMTKSIEDIIRYVGRAIQIWKKLTVREVMRGCKIPDKKFNLCRGALVRLANAGVVVETDKHTFELVDLSKLSNATGGHKVKVLTEQEILLAKERARGG